jgi:hypothetical protein
LFPFFFQINYKYFIEELPKWFNLLHASGIIHSQSRPLFHILNSRALMHSLWTSIRCSQCSSPSSMMYTLRAVLVFGQVQQGFSGFFSWDSDLSLNSKEKCPRVVLPVIPQCLLEVHRKAFGAQAQGRNHWEPGARGWHLLVPCLQPQYCWP